MKLKLKIGVLLDGTNVPFWASKAIQRIDMSEYAEIVLLVLDEEAEQANEPFLYRTYKWFDNKFNGSKCDPFAPKELPASLSQVDRVYLKRRNGASEEVDQDAVIGIMERKLDFLIDVRNVTLRDDISHLSRFGILSFSLGDGISYDGKYAGLWEILDNAPITGSHVKRIHKGNVSTVYRSYSPTIVWSEWKNRARSYHKGISFLPRVLETYHNSHEDSMASESTINLDEWRKSLRTGPRNQDIIDYFLRYFPKGVRYLTHRMLYEGRWAVCYRFGDGIPTSFNDFIMLLPPSHTWWGDPHVIRQDDDYYIFVEEMSISKGANKGHISMFKLDGEKGYKSPVNVLEQPYHLAYPTVFKFKDTYYMMVDSSYANKITLFEAVDFPFKWKHARDIMTGIFALDPTIFRKDGRWWLFCNIRENDGASPNDELFLFHSDDLLSEHWEPHPLNPIITDVRRARPAGPVFELNGSLYRPSQDCSVFYGHAVNINKITDLDTQKYNEVHTAYIEPKNFPNASRVHTFSYIPGLTVVDIFIDKSKLFPNRKKRSRM